MEMLIDCESCTARPRACSECMVSALLGVPEGAAQLGEEEAAVLNLFVDEGLLPRLRLVRSA